MTAPGLTPAAIATVRLEADRTALARIKERLGEGDADTVVRALDALGATSTAHRLIELLDRITR